jgi:hypothetical protein
MSGIVRYVPYERMLAYLAMGWRWGADMGGHRDHLERQCVILWWCCGACRDGEAP